MTWREFSRRAQRVPQPRPGFIHLRARRPDGLVTAHCIRHVKRPPDAQGDLLVSTDRSRVTCVMCKADEVS